MYANLEVHMRRARMRDGIRVSSREVVAAWWIGASQDGKLLVHTDLNEGQSNYAVEGPVIELAPHELLSVSASF